MGRKVSLACIIFLLLCLFLYPREALAASRQGLNLWLFTLLPTLLPFMILSNFLIHSDFIEKILSPLGFLWKFLLGLSPYGAYVFLLGMLCGYPMGAKLAGDLYRNRKLSKTEAKYLLTFANNASPVFISTYVAVNCLNRDDLIGRSLGIIYLSDFLCSLIFRVYFSRRKKKSMQSPEIFPKEKETSSVQSLTALADASIMNGFETITRLGGYILLFSVLAAFLSKFWPFSLTGKYLVLGLTEISTGLSFLGQSGFSSQLLGPLALAFTSFGGLCILAQTKGVLYENHLSILPCLAGKCLNGILTFILALFIL